MTELLLYQSPPTGDVEKIQKSTLLFEAMMRENSATNISATGAGLRKSLKAILRLILYGRAHDRHQAFIIGPVGPPVEARRLLPGFRRVAAHRRSLDGGDASRNDARKALSQLICGRSIAVVATSDIQCAAKDGLESYSCLLKRCSESSSRMPAEFAAVHHSRLELAGAGRLQKASSGQRGRA